MGKHVRSIELGDYIIDIREDDRGHREARLSSGSNGGLLEIEKLDDGRLRIRDLDIGSANIDTEHLALMLVMIGADGELVSHIDKINKARKHLDD